MISLRRHSWPRVKSVFCWRFKKLRLICMTRVGGGSSGVESATGRLCRFRTSDDKPHHVTDRENLPATVKTHNTTVKNDRSHSDLASHHAPPLPPSVLTDALDPALLAAPLLGQPRSRRRRIRRTAHPPSQSCHPHRNHSSCLCSGPTASHRRRFSGGE